MSVLVAVLFPLSMYVLLVAYARYIATHTHTAELFLEDRAAWEDAIMPYAPLPAPKTAYYADDMTLVEWTTQLTKMADASKFDESVWIEAGAFGYNKAALNACMNAASAALAFPPAAKVVVKRVRAPAFAGSTTGIPLDVRVWDVLACFHRPGRARGWCANLTIWADYRADVLVDWTLGVIAAQPVGVVSESAILLRPFYAPTRLIS